MRPKDSDQVTVVSQGIGLTLAEIHSALDTDALRARFPPILGPERFAEMVGVSVNTGCFWLEHGQLSGAQRRRGKRQFIWRDRAILLFLNGQLGDRQKAPRLHLGESGLGLADEEINRAFASREGIGSVGPILSPEQLAELLGLSRGTIYFWIQQGHFTGAVTKRGKRQLFWRTRAVAALFNGPDWDEIHD